MGFFNGPLYLVCDRNLDAVLVTETWILYQLGKFGVRYQLPTPKSVDSGAENKVINQPAPTV